MPLGLAPAVGRDPQGDVAMAEAVERPVGGQRRLSRRRPATGARPAPSARRRSRARPPSCRSSGRRRRPASVRGREPGATCVEASPGGPSQWPASFRLWIAPEVAQLQVLDRRRAPVSGSMPEAVLGKAITSRICRRREAHDDAVEPEAMPPCGGAPKCSASSRKPKRASASRRRCRAPRRPAAARRRGGYGSSRRRAPGRSRRCRRPAPAPRRDSPGRARRHGAVKGWCSESQRFSPSFHSNSGKSTIQTRRARPRRSA